MTRPSDRPPILLVLLLFTLLLAAVLWLAAASPAPEPPSDGAPAVGELRSQPVAESTANTQRSAGVDAR